MRQASVYVSASRVETFGLTIIEALASGKPVVTTPTSGGKDIIGEHPKIGVVSKAISSEALSESILTVFRHPNRYSPTDIRSNALQRFDQTVVVQEAISLYKEILHDY